MEINIAKKSCHPDSKYGHADTMVPITRSSMRSPDETAIGMAHSECHRDPRSTVECVIMCIVNL